MAYQKFCEQNLISDRKCLGSHEKMHKTPKQSAMSNRNLFLVLTYKALNYNCDTLDSPSNTNNNTTAHKPMVDIKHS